MRNSAGDWNELVRSNRRWVLRKNKAGLWAQNKAAGTDSNGMRGFGATIDHLMDRFQVKITLRAGSA